MKKKIRISPGAELEENGFLPATDRLIDTNGSRHVRLAAELALVRSTVAVVPSRLRLIKMNDFYCWKTGGYGPAIGKFPLFFFFFLTVLAASSLLWRVAQLASYAGDLADAAIQSVLIVGV